MRNMSAARTAHRPSTCHRARTKKLTGEQMETGSFDTGHTKVSNVTQTSANNSRVLILLNVVGKYIRNHIQYFLPLVLFTFCTCCILRCLVCIVVSCLVCIVIVVLCVLL